MTTDPMKPIDPLKPLAGRTAIVTGSGRNLGRGMILAFAKAGANVVVNGHRDQAAIEAVADEARAGAEALTILADVSQPDEVVRMVAETVDRFGSADIAVANVGLRPRQAFLDISVEDWRRVIETNLSSAFYLARAVLPEMKKRNWGESSTSRAGTGSSPSRTGRTTSPARRGCIRWRRRSRWSSGSSTSPPTPSRPARWIRCGTKALSRLPGGLGRGGEGDAAAPARHGRGCGRGLRLPRLRREYVTGQLLHLNGGEFVF